jgi:uncharacterized protein (TIGR02246 family)
MSSQAPHSPAAVSEAFVAAVNAGNLERAVDLYRTDAVLLAPDGQCARGADAIRELLAGLLAMQVAMTTRIEQAIEVGEVAVASESWTMSPQGTGTAGSEQSGRSIVVFVRGEEGWRFLVDAPWGL